MIRILKSFCEMTLLTALFFPAHMYKAFAEEAHDIKYPQKIISLVPYITEEIYLLGAQDRLAGCTIYCTKPPEAAEKEKVGTAVKVNVEKIFSIRPDLVLASSLSDAAQMKRLEELGLEVAFFNEAKSFEDICGQFMRLGRMLGREEKAAEIVAVSRERVEAVRDRVEKLKRPDVFIQIGTSPLVTATEESFLNDYITLAGGRNIAAKAKGRIYSREQVLMSNPDIIIIVSMGIVSGKEKKTWQIFETLAATQNNAIHILDAYTVCSPTPLTFAAVLEDVADILHR